VASAAVLADDDDDDDVDGTREKVCDGDESAALLAAPRLEFASVSCLSSASVVKSS